MSIDVFGRQLKETKGTRGPPGIGYKLTTEGHYDIDDKKICNVAAPTLSKDAVNLDTLQRIIQMEIRGIYDITTRLRNDIDDLSEEIEGHRDDLDKKLLKIESDLRLLVETISIKDQTT